MGAMIVKDERGLMEVDGYPLTDLAREWGTPLYVYSKRQIEADATRLKKALGAHFDRFHISYALKANSNPHIVKILKDLGLGADCSSPAEALLAARMGFPTEKSIYTGNFESPQDLKVPLKNRMTINLDDHARAQNPFEDSPLPPVLSFRINPGIGRGGFEGIITGGADAKFGIPYEKCGEAYAWAKSLGIDRFGIHMMTGSNILNPFYFAEITGKLLSIIETHLCPLGIELEFINIGGGLGLPYSPEEKELDVEEVFRLVADVFHPKVERLSIGHPALAIEPGRYLVGRAGLLLSTVTHVKESYRTYMGLDSGMNTLLRPSLYGAYHPIHLDGKSQTNAVSPYWVCGQVCENSDLHPKARDLETPTPGDLAVMEYAGAYGFAMSSHYNGRPRPAEVLITEDGPELIREREEDGDIFLRVPHFSLNAEGPK
ncbi:MAG: diaminopimelate decarboxylase [Bacteriovoracales bacterium]|nr:diaminopimelate decarboxylase [Bacteriovoracales bacterium]